MVNEAALIKKQAQKRGVVLGTLIPIVFSPLVAFILFSYRPPKNHEGLPLEFWTFYNQLLSHDSQLPTFISLCTLVNLPIFFILLKLKKDFMAKGMIYSTLAYAIVFFLMKLL